MEYSAKIYEGIRLDVAVSKIDPEITRSRAQKSIESGEITVNGTVKKVNYKVKSQDMIEISVGEVKPCEILPVDLPLDIIFEDKDVVVINKDKNVVVHPAPGHYDDTLVNAIMYHIKDLSGIGGEMRPGIVHRIDKDTTGLIVIAKNDYAHNFLSEQLKDKTMNREYMAICKGNISAQEVIVEKNIVRHKNDRKKMTVCKESEGRYAKTLVTVIKQSEGYSLIRCKLFTGRTHQIRVHLSSIGHPLVGDLVYGKKSKVNFEGQALHAFSLEFIHPTTKKKVSFNAPIPKDFCDLQRKLKLDD